MYKEKCGSTHPLWYTATIIVLATNPISRAYAYSLFYKQLFSNIHNAYLAASVFAYQCMPYVGNKLSKTTDPSRA